ncbi:hypothetical protein TNCT_173451 [Trichonephila clavata]|uniref:Uncharacterized protein n=1 Tax=Trichonephila clavata TaxID=2740835 RepID=A0A8X6HNI6_TRICU|nr:hypothetical protein TNCT_173451 [Trichonephila clavata]
MEECMCDRSATHGIIQRIIIYSKTKFRKTLLFRHDHHDTLIVEPVWLRYDHGRSSVFVRYLGNIDAADDKRMNPTTSIGRGLKLLKTTHR